MYFMRKGFTLVELSIVLVIIGLLIGGILAAQSMISSAKIQKTVKQIEQFDIASANVVTKFNCLPGDCRMLYNAGEFPLDPWGRVANGYINRGGPSNPADPSWYYDEWGEPAWFWIQLQRGVGFMPDKTFSSTNPASGFAVTGASVNSPAIDLAPDIGVIAGVTSEPYWSGGGTGEYNIYQLANYGTTNGITTVDYMIRSQPPIPSSLAMALDGKMDDGRPLTGFVRSTCSDGNNVPFGSVLCTPPTCYDAVSGQYVVGEKAPGCSLGIIMMRNNQTN